MIDILAAIRSWANAISDRSCSAAARYFFAGSRGSSAANATGKRADFTFTVASRNPICGHGLRCFRPSKRILMDQLQEANRSLQPPLLGIGRNYFQCLGTRVSSSFRTRLRGMKRRILKLNQTATVGSSDRFGSAHDIQLAENASYVRFYLRLADEKIRADLFIASTAGDHLENIDLPAG